MSVRQGKCINTGLCALADTGEIITIPRGESFTCPADDCRNPLQALPPRRRWRLVLPLAVLAALAVAFLFWRQPTQPLAAATVQPAGARSAMPQPSLRPTDRCRQIDWPKATATQFLTNNCVGQGILAYDDRLDYVYSLQEIKDWSSLTRDDPRLHDCAEVRACEQRAEELARPVVAEHVAAQRVAAPVEIRASERVDWAKASCEDVTKVWESEDPRLSTSTCGSLSEAGCSHIKRCLGLHPVSVGPGSSKNEPEGSKN